MRELKAQVRTGTLVPLVADLVVKHAEGVAAGSTLAPPKPSASRQWRQKSKASKPAQQKPKASEPEQQKSKASEPAQQKPAASKGSGLLGCDPQMIQLIHEPQRSMAIELCRASTHVEMYHCLHC